MRNTRGVEFDTKCVEGNISMSTVFPNKSVAQEAYEILHSFVEREHRGRFDTWTAARDRVAIKIGLPVSYAKRLWQRWEQMDDVSGDALRSLYRAQQAREKHAERKAQATAAIQMAKAGNQNDHCGVVQ